MPPLERVPIITHLSAYSKEKVISAIKYELDHGGQGFYVLPRIKGFEEVMEFLEQLFPNVEIAIAHGKGPNPLSCKKKKNCGHAKANLVSERFKDQYLWG